MNMQHARYKLIIEKDNLNEQIITLPLSFCIKKIPSKKLKVIVKGSLNDLYSE